MRPRGGTATRIASGARRWSIWTHRYVGIPLSPLFVIWFVSGVVMMYTGMPELTPEERLDRRSPLDPSRVRLTPAAAAEAGGVQAPPAEARLLSVMGRPAYRFDDVTVFADDGERLSPIGADEAREVVRRFTGAPASAIAHERLVEQPDQWMLIAQQFLPAHKLRVSDGAGTQVYVERRTADVATGGRSGTSGSSSSCWAGWRRPAPASGSEPDGSAARSAACCVVLIDERTGRRRPPGRTAKRAARRTRRRQSDPAPRPAAPTPRAPFVPRPPFAPPRCS